MSNVIIYHKPACSTCRQAVQLLKESGQPFTAINYYEVPFTKSQLKAILRKAHLAPKEVLRKKEEIYKKLGLAKQELSEEALIEIMIQNPDLIERPLVEKGAKALLARPAETIKVIL